VQRPVFGEHTVNREPRGYTIFYSANEINATYDARLPLTSSLSVLLWSLARTIQFQAFRGGDGRGNAPGDSAGAAVSGRSTWFALGARRILRTSPLTRFRRFADRISTCLIGAGEVPSASGSLLRFLRFYPHRGKIEHCCSDI